MAEFTVSPTGQFTQTAPTSIQTRNEGPQPPTGGGGGPAPAPAAPPFELPEGFGEFPEMTEEEKALLGQMTEVLRVQTEHLKNQTQLFADLMPAQRDLFDWQVHFSLADMGKDSYLKGVAGSYIQREMGMAFDVMKQREGLDAAAINSSMDLLSGKAPSISGEQRGLLDTIYGEQQRQGEAAIRQNAEELAAGRGFNLTDTPIGGDVFLRNLAEFQSGLGAERASAELGLGVQQQQMRQAEAQFQQQMRAQASSNRAQLGLAAFGSGGGVQSPGAMPTVGSVDTGGAASALGALSGSRNAQANFMLGQGSLMQQQAAMAQQAQLTREGFASAANVAGIANRGNEPSAWETWAPIIGGGMNIFGSLL